MNLHEYQGKQLLNSYGVATQRGIVAQTVEEAIQAYHKMQEDTKTDFCVIKAQIHAGGRGKGGGVKLAKKPYRSKRNRRKYLRNDVAYSANSGRNGRSGKISQKNPGY